MSYLSILLHIFLLILKLIVLDFKSIILGCSIAFKSEIKIDKNVYFILNVTSKSFTHFSLVMKFACINN